MDEVRNFFASMLEQADRVAHSRSSVLVPLQWILMILAVFFLALVLVRAPEWALIGDGAGLLMVLSLCVAAYIYFGLKSPDCLRSEQYSLSKYAIQQGLYGDSDSGMKEGLPTVLDRSMKLQMMAKEDQL